jgi:hypothetical protein
VRDSSARQLFPLTPALSPAIVRVGIGESNAGERGQRDAARRAGCHSSFRGANGDDGRPHNFCDRSRSALAITDTELKLMAAAAIIGLSRMPKKGYSTPAAIGTPMML